MQQGQMGVVAHFAIHAGRHDDFEEAARDATAFVQTNEPDGLIYDCHIADDGTSAAVYEVWASPEAVLAHLQGTVGADVLPRMLSAAEMTSVDLFGPATPELLATVEGLPVTAYGTAFAALDR